VTTAVYRNDPYYISTDPARLNRDFIHDWLANVSYWAQGRPRDVVDTSIEHSVCFGVYEDGQQTSSDQQIGFARLVTDHATFAWLCDVFIAESHRGRGLGKWLIACVTDYVNEHCPRALFLLATRDAHGLYRDYGDFVPLDSPERWMVRPKRKGDVCNPPLSPQNDI
jgi:GNAT superfamily N-acetyltransferase